MEADAELPEAKCLERLFAVLDGLDGLHVNVGSVGNAGAKTGCGGTVPEGESCNAGEFTDLGFLEAGFDKRRFDLMNFRSGLARAVVAEVVLVNAVDDVGDAALDGQLFQAQEEFIFAMKATVRVVGGVGGVVEFERWNELVSEAADGGVLGCIAFVGFRNGR